MQTKKRYAKKLFLARDNITQILFLLPAFLIFTIFFIYPVSTSLMYSFTDWNGISRSYNFVGFQNYKTMFSTSSIFATIPTTLYFAALNALCLIVIAFFVALVLNRKSKITGFVRISFFLPMLVNSMICGFFFKEFYAPVLSADNMGSLNRILIGLGLSSLTGNWLGNPNTVMLVVVLTGVWYQVGTTALIYLANMQSIPTELYESAKIDGCGYWKQTYFITWRLIKPALTINMILLLINSLKEFYIISILTGGGPGTATKVISIAIMDLSVNSYMVGLGCAMSMVVTVAVFAIVIAIQKFMTRETD